MSFSSTFAPKFARLSLLDRLRHVVASHARPAQVSSMQHTSYVIMHALFRAGIDVPVLFVDTGFHFEETHDVLEEYRARFGLDIRRVEPAMPIEDQDRMYGAEAWRTPHGQRTCCFLRKEQPLLDYVYTHGFDATIKGLIRSDGGKRAHISPIERDARCGTTVYHPLFDWTRRDVFEYIQEWNLPVNELYYKMYTSIGCAPCTTPTNPGEDVRAGRWRHLKEQTAPYCGINASDQR